MSQDLTRSCAPVGRGIIFPFEVVELEELEATGAGVAVGVGGSSEPESEVNGLLKRLGKLGPEPGVGSRSRLIARAGSFACIIRGGAGGSERSDIASRRTTGGGGEEIG